MTKVEAETFVRSGGLESVIEKLRAAGFTDVRAEVFEKDGEPCIGLKGTTVGKAWERSLYVREAWPETAVMFFYEEAEAAIRASRRPG